MRLSVFKSNKHIFAQIIDDGRGMTLLAASDLNPEVKKDKKGLKKVEIAKMVGELLGQKAIQKKISEVFFDKGCSKYHGRVKALAEGARAAGLKF